MTIQPYLSTRTRVHTTLTQEDYIALSKYTCMCIHDTHVRRTVQPSLATCTRVHTTLTQKDPIALAKYTYICTDNTHTGRTLQPSLTARTFVHTTLTYEELYSPLITRACVHTALTSTKPPRQLLRGARQNTQTAQIAVDIRRAVCNKVAIAASGQDNGFRMQLFNCLLPWDELGKTKLGVCQVGVLLQQLTASHKAVLLGQGLTLSRLLGGNTCMHGMHFAGSIAELV